MLLTLLWVRGRERGHTDGQISVRPNVRAVDKGVRSGNGPRLQGELGLDRGVVTHELVLSRQNELVDLRKPSLLNQALVVLRHARRLSGDGRGRWDTRGGHGGWRTRGGSRAGRKHRMAQYSVRELHVKPDIFLQKPVRKIARQLTRSKESET